MRRLSLVLCSVLALLATAAAQDIKYVGSWGNLILYQQFEQPFWSERVPELLDGVATDVTSFDQMGLRGAEVYRFLDMGLFDVSATVADYVVADAPALEGLDLPVLAPDIETARQVAEAYKPVLDQAMQEAFNAKLLSVVPYPAQVVFCNEPVTSLADLRGKKVRASGRSTAEFVEAVGATSVTLAFNEVPQSLERGVVECAITGSTSGYSAGWGEVASHLYPLPIGGWDHVVTAMSLGSWEALGEENQRKLLDAIHDELETPIWQAIGEDTQRGIECLTGSECGLGEPAGMTLSPVQEADLQRSREILETEVLPSWAGRVGPEWVERWNDTVGSVTGLNAAGR
jgi:TRAP-type C4-dicarboxylate transport system substrate-binding protein